MSAPQLPLELVQIICGCFDDPDPSYSAGPAIVKDNLHSPLQTSRAKCTSHDGTASGNDTSQGSSKSYDPAARVGQQKVTAHKDQLDERYDYDEDELSPFNSDPEGPDDSVDNDNFTREKEDEEEDRSSYVARMVILYRLSLVDRVFNVAATPLLYRKICYYWPRGRDKSADFLVGIMRHPERALMVRELSIREWGIGFDPRSLPACHVDEFAAAIDRYADFLGRFSETLKQKIRQGHEAPEIALLLLLCEDVQTVSFHFRRGRFVSIALSILHIATDKAVQGKQSCLSNVRKLRFVEHRHCNFRFARPGRIGLPRLKDLSAMGSRGIAGAILAVSEPSLRNLQRICLDGSLFGTEYSIGVLKKCPELKTLDIRNGLIAEYMINWEEVSETIIDYGRSLETLVLDLHVHKNSDDLGVATTTLNLVKHSSLKHLTVPFTLLFRNLWHLIDGSIKFEDVLPQSLLTLQLLAPGNKAGVISEYDEFGPTAWARLKEQREYRQVSLRSLEKINFDIGQWEWAEYFKPSP